MSLETVESLHSKLHCVMGKNFLKTDFLQRSFLSSCALVLLMYVFFFNLGGRGSSPVRQRPPSPPPPQTVTEAQLPWRRGLSTEQLATDDSPVAVSNDHPLVQQEFPSWVENRDYNAYVSPTTTFLNRLEPRATPPVYQIFEETGEELQETCSTEQALSDITSDRNTTQL